MTRAELITQLRTALMLAECPEEDCVEFEIGDTDFCFEFEEGVVAGKITFGRED